MSGPFTVETLSPHRKLSAPEREVLKADKGLTFHGPDKFAQMIVENLRKAGVQNTFKGERLQFDYIDFAPGQYVQARGEYHEKDGKTRRVAICIGPEFGTVDSDLLREAVMESMQGERVDLLLVCGFNFDPLFSQDAKQYGRLFVQKVKLNGDLMMGDELLKKTNAANLFMIFGEPDIEVKKLPDDKLQVELKGFDVFDPTISDVRPSSLDEIACWFIDTNYDGISFFVRHAYFTGADKPYEKLKRTLKAEIDEDAWEQLYATVSRPFPRPEKGKIAVKVINHFGDEDMQVYSV